jgi:hypothetical protein
MPPLCITTGPSTFAILFTRFISKLLPNRLKPLLNNIISPFQTAFVPNCHIQDNSILAHEMLHTFKSKRGREGLMVVHINMEKAFDKMEWSFLLPILTKLGFHPKWIIWIRLHFNLLIFSVTEWQPFRVIFPI